MPQKSKIEQEVDAQLAEFASKLSNTSYGKEMRKHFAFDPEWINLNHGSFGATPKSITALQHHFMNISERRPDHWIRYLFPELLIKSRTALSHLLSTPRSNLVLVPNATTGVNTVLRSLTFQPGDKIVYFNFIYGGCHHTVQYITESTPLESIRINITLPVSDDDLLATFTHTLTTTPGVKIAIFDTITSQPAARLPFERLTAECRRLGVLSLVDAAHGVGQIPLHLSNLDPDFFVSNLHKWLFVPRGCAVLYVPQRNQKLIRSTLPTSWGFQPLEGGVVSPLPKPQSLGEGECTGYGVCGDEEWTDQFTFNGTTEACHYALIPAALKFCTDVCGGEEKIYAYLERLADKAEVIFKSVLGTGESFGAPSAMRNIKAPIDVEAVKRQGGEVCDIAKWMELKLVEEEDMFITVTEYGGAMWVRVSAQVYLDEDDLRRGAVKVREWCERAMKGEWVEQKKSEGKL
ncbi:PLP-dependent transferase [Ascodesmis nigricans]|uniref:PLP-dependent transferase n=1 Tax=Ascodesmis nigricans TaxID=341454 RepID=A0A4S2MR08_9PEZI|nr:PLP-dependent transferase [Ascodesmis nigricans]